MRRRRRKHIDDTAADTETAPFLGKRIADIAHIRQTAGEFRNFDHIAGGERQRNALPYGGRDHAAGHGVFGDHRQERFSRRKPLQYMDAAGVLTVVSGHGFIGEQITGRIKPRFPEREKTPRAVPYFFCLIIGFRYIENGFALLLHGRNSQKKAHLIAGAAQFIPPVRSVLKDPAVSRNILPKEIRFFHFDHIPLFLCIIL